MTTLHSSIIRWQQYSRLANNAATRFSTTRYEAAENAYPLHLGSARVGIPKIHAPGELESPSILRLEFVEDPGKHVMLRSVVVDDSPTDWFSRVSEQVRYAAAREGFIFIHGFNVRFADALKRTAQLSHDLEIDGPVISYSWPSRGQATAYAADEATIAWSAPHFERLLIDLYTKTDCRTFNIVAHSMGNRALLEAIERIYLRMGGPNAKPENPRLINELVLAAPDVDAGEFAQDMSGQSSTLRSMRLFIFPNTISLCASLKRSTSHPVSAAMARRLAWGGSNRFALANTDCLRPAMRTMVEIGPYWMIWHRS